MIDPLLNARAAARVLAVCEKQLWLLTAPRGPIPLIRIGKRGIRYDVGDLQRFIDEQKTGKTTESGEVAGEGFLA